MISSDCGHEYEKDDDYDDEDEDDDDDGRMPTFLIKR